MHKIALSMSQPVILHFSSCLVEALDYQMMQSLTSNQKQEPDQHAEYVTKWKTAMQEAYLLSSKSAMKSAIRGKRNYDKSVRSSALQVGDHVLVRNHTPHGGTGKLCAFWEDIARKGEGSPVYDVRPESGQGQSRTLH